VRGDSGSGGATPLDRLRAEAAFGDGLAVDEVLAVDSGLRGDGLRGDGLAGDGLAVDDVLAVGSGLTGDVP
jgi:hypothetical protein